MDTNPKPNPSSPNLKGSKKRIQSVGEAEEGTGSSPPNPG